MNTAQTAIRNLSDRDIFTFGGRKFRVTFTDDSDGGYPWVECDGHGSVRHDTVRSKAPGERPMSDTDRSGCAWLYDWQSAIATARCDGWGMAPEWIANAEKTKGRKLTRGEIAAAAVEKDFQYLRGFVNDEWSYIRVTVTLLDDDETDTAQSLDLWAVESCGDYKSEAAEELARELLSAANAEQVEREHWAARDVVTRGAS